MDKEMPKKFIIRHGDVLLIHDNEKDIKIDSEIKNVKTALGEVSGHSHKISHVKASFDNEGLAESIQVVQEVGAITHEEHETLPLPKTTYARRIQREYDVIEGVRTVMD